MAKRSLEKQNRFLREKTAQGVLAVLFGTIGIILALAAFNKAGIAGEKIYGLLTKFVGIGFFLLPILSIIISVGFLRALRGSFPIKKTIGSCFLSLCGMGIIDIIFPMQSGSVGNLIGTVFSRLFGVYATIVILAAIFIISVLVMFETSLPFFPILAFLSKIRRRKNAPRIINGAFEEREPYETENPNNHEERSRDETINERGKEKNAQQEKPMREDETGFVIAERKNAIGNYLGAYVPPPLSLLEGDRGKPGVGDIKANANIIKRTLQNFSIEVEMDEISIGPAVTRYALKPAEGVKLSRIVALQNDLALALAAHPIRIEAPIPGKSLVGIEIPNNIKATVGLATMLGSLEFRTSEKPLLVSLGKDLGGKPHFANLSKMPHLLIAGATGAGKSVTIHTLITSLLFRNSPEVLKLILIDPKRVELTLYNKIPHLLTPVLTDAKKVILALKWAAKEMDRRYDILESESVRDIHSYHKNVLEPELKRAEKFREKKGADEESKLPERLPYIVIIIDELADIMTIFPRELEAAIVRLAQMSRATGIHLVLSTQRPSVNIITGLIKANIPARIALQVSSQIDSRTILDTGGAEKLLGAGDMLFLSGEMSKPIRLQSAYISEGEVKKVTAHLAKAYRENALDESVLATNDNTFFDETLSDNQDIDDNLYEEARLSVIQAGKASTSYLQRKLRIGYSRAARLMDMLEERNVIGPADGSRPRTVSGATSSPQNENMPGENTI